MNEIQHAHEGRLCAAQCFINKLDFNYNVPKDVFRVLCKMAGECIQCLFLNQQSMRPHKHRRLMQTHDNLAIAVVVIAAVVAHF